jgi:Uma2 family endonuclease
MGAVTLLTAEEYLNMPETPGRYELPDGELISLPVAKRFHNKIGRSFEDLLQPHWAGRVYGLWNDIGFAAAGSFPM